MANAIPWSVALMFLAALASQGADAVIQCSDAVSQVIPCETFLLSGGVTPSAGCCTGVQALDKIASSSQPDRKAICQCFKDTAKSFPINLAKAQQLPKLCNVTLPAVAIGPDVDCDRV